MHEMRADAINLLDLSSDELTQMIVDWGEPRFRAAQVWRWIYHTLTDDISEMVNLPIALRKLLAEKTYINRLTVVDSVVSDDGLAEKVLFRATDANLFEAVLMRYTNRNTVCVSSQLGCAVGCVFCATGQGGFVRDLTTGEIAAQVLHFARELRTENALVTNVVLMGMGEPMLNFDAVWRAILNLNDGEGLGLGMRRFTVSTAGIAPGIERMARESQSLGLAVSLHAANDALRDQLVPSNRRYPLDRLLQAVRFFIERTGRRVTFEYALVSGLNDSDAHAHEVVALLSGLLCHVNLIALNPTPECGFVPSPQERVLRFQEILVKGRIQTTVRLRRGVDIQAGCGQLRQGHINL